ncbi:MAG: DUF4278 domain-containing protein [Synechococcales bacterium]|nr:DUF4278 domain-containing protein [Synechococcales bacterium]
MELQYRGVKYQPFVSAIATHPSHPCGTYRGRPTKIHQAPAPTPDAVIALQYRGHTYLGERFGVKPNLHQRLVSFNELER